MGPRKRRSRMARALAPDSSPPSQPKENTNPLPNPFLTPSALSSFSSSSSLLSSGSPVQMLNSFTGNILVPGLQTVALSAFTLMYPEEASWLFSSPGEEGYRIYQRGSSKNLASVNYEDVVVANETVLRAETEEFFATNAETTPGLMEFVKAFVEAYQKAIETGTPVDVNEFYNITPKPGEFSFNNWGNGTINNNMTTTLSPPSDLGNGITLDTLWYMSKFAALPTVAIMIGMATFYSLYQLGKRPAIHVLLQASMLYEEEEEEEDEEVPSSSSSSPADTPPSYSTIVSTNMPPMPKPWRKTTFRKPVNPLDVLRRDVLLEKNLDRRAYVNTIVLAWADELEERLRYVQKTIARTIPFKSVSSLSGVGDGGPFLIDPEERITIDDVNPFAGLVAKIDEEYSRTLLMEDVKAAYVKDGPRREEVYMKQAQDIKEVQDFIRDEIPSPPPDWDAVSFQERLFADISKPVFEWLFRVNDMIEEQEKNQVSDTTLITPNIKPVEEISEQATSLDMQKIIDLEKAAEDREKAAKLREEIKSTPLDGDDASKKNTGPTAADAVASSVKTDTSKPAVMEQRSSLSSNITWLGESVSNGFARIFDGVKPFRTDGLPVKMYERPITPKKNTYTKDTDTSSKTTSPIETNKERGKLSSIFLDNPENGPGDDYDTIATYPFKTIEEKKPSTAETLSKDVSSPSSPVPLTPPSGSEPSSPTPKPGELKGDTTVVPPRVLGEGEEGVGKMVRRGDEGIREEEKSIMNDAKKVLRAAQKSGKKDVVIEQLSRLADSNMDKPMIEAIKPDVSPSAVKEEEEEEKENSYPPPVYSVDLDEEDGGYPWDDDKEKLWDEEDIPYEAGYEPVFAVAVNTPEEARFYTRQRNRCIHDLYSHKKFFESCTSPPGVDVFSVFKEKLRKSPPSPGEVLAPTYAWIHADMRAVFKENKRRGVL